MTQSNAVLQDGAVPPEPTVTLPDLRAKAAVLRRIQQALVGRENGSMAPRQLKANLVAVASGIALLALLTGPAAFIKTWIGTQTAVALVAATCVLVSVTYALFSKSPSTWTLVMDEALARYCPMDRTAFIHLQSELKDAGYLDPYAIRVWLESEKARVDSARKRITEAPASKFLKKEL